jgi:hypothetical protein
MKRMKAAEPRSTAEDASAAVAWNMHRRTVQSALTEAMSLAGDGAKTDAMSGK